MTRSDNMTVSDCDLRYWHFADVSERTEDIRRLESSGHANIAPALPKTT
jgi:hypothetical protein